MPPWLLKLLAQLAISIGIPALLKIVPGLDPALVEKIIKIIEEVIGSTKQAKVDAMSLVSMTIEEHQNAQV